jgi:hypothetical protein
VLLHGKQHQIGLQLLGRVPEAMHLHREWNKRIHPYCWYHRHLDACCEVGKAVSHTEWANNPTCSAQSRERVHLGPRAMPNNHETPS